MSPTKVRTRLPIHLENFRSNLAEVQKLLEIHSRLGGTKPGRRDELLSVLHKSAIVLLVSCWEYFVENLAEQAFRLMINSTTDPLILPKKVMAIASNPLRNDPDELKVWRLAGSGWKSVLTEHKKHVLDKHIEFFNTPKSKQVDGLFHALIGFRSLSKQWHWTGVRSSCAIRHLNELITVRGDIAHKVTTAEKIGKARVVQETRFIRSLGIVTSNRVGEYLERIVKVRPWIYARIGGVK